MDRRRCSRMTNRQMEILLSFMEKNEDISKSLTFPLSKDKRKTMWEDLAEELNSDGWGPTKTIERWKKTWTDWKCNVRHRVRQMKRKKKMCPSDGPVPDNLSSTDKRMIAIIEKTTGFIETLISPTISLECLNVPLTSAIDIDETAETQVPEIKGYSDDYIELDDTEKDVPEIKGYSVKRKRKPANVVEDIRKPFSTDETDKMKILKDISLSISIIANAMTQQTELLKKQVELIEKISNK